MLDLETSKARWEESLLAVGIRLKLTALEREVFKAPKPHKRAPRPLGRLDYTRNLVALGRVLPRRGRVYISVRSWEDRYPLQVAWSLSPQGGIRGRLYLYWRKEWLEDTQQ